MNKEPIHNSRLPTVCRLLLTVCLSLPIYDYDLRFTHHSLLPLGEGRGEGLTISTNPSPLSPSQREGDEQGKPIHNSRLPAVCRLALSASLPHSLFTIYDSRFTASGCLLFTRHLRFPLHGFRFVLPVTCHLSPVTRFDPFTIYDSPITPSTFGRGPGRGPDDSRQTLPLFPLPNGKGMNKENPFTIYGFRLFAVYSSIHDLRFFFLCLALRP
jgi:hypothetical protein